MHTSAHPTQSATRHLATLLARHDPAETDLLGQALDESQDAYERTRRTLVACAPIIAEASTELASLASAGIGHTAERVDLEATAASGVLTISARICASDHADAARHLAARGLHAQRTPAVLHSGRGLADVPAAHLYEHWAPADQAWRLLLIIDRSTPFHVPARVDAIATDRSGVAA